MQKYHLATLIRIRQVLQHWTQLKNGGAFFKVTLQAVASF
jgi:hypothetical protein